jgi:hypothetical protein
MRRIVQRKKSIVKISSAGVIDKAKSKGSRAQMRYSHKMPSRFPSRGDQKLIQIVDSALADVTQRSGKWLACRPGCTQCCIGAFPINQLDATRLQRGLADLAKRDPERAARIRSFPAIPSAVSCAKARKPSGSSPILRMTNPVRS